MCTSENGSMLTSANQYLRPEYLPPVSSPLDANKSPLALLAKTCSNIGVDTPSIKSLTGSSSSSNSSSTGSGSSSRTTPKSKSTDYGDSSKLNFKPYECSGSRNRPGLDSGSRASPSSKHTSVSSGKAQVPSPTANGSTHASEKSQSSSAPLSYTSLGLPDMHKDSLAAFYKAYGFLAPNCCPTTGATSYPTMMPPPIALDKTGAYPSIYPPAPSATAAAALAAYNYARMKSGMGLVPGLTNPLCRDPYCAGSCGNAPFHNSHAALLAASSSLAFREAAGAGQNVNGSSGGCTPATCPNGCNQCEHQRYLAAIAAAYTNSFPGLTGGYPSPVSSSYANSLAAAAALHHRTASSAVTGTVCNWMAGDTHCGKRFATSEELLQHLKTHTAAMQNVSASSESRATPTGSTPTPSGTQSPGAPPRPASGTPSPLSQSARLSVSSGATGTSPTPSHTLHSNRYHPYSKPSTASPSLPPSNLPSANPFPVAANGTPGGSVPPFGPSPFLTPVAAASLPSFAPNLYYPYMAPSLFSGRIGPPVPP